MCAADALEPSPFPTRSGPEAQLVERAHGGRTQHAPRPTCRHRRAGAHGGAAPSSVGTRRQVDVAGAGDDAPSRPRAEQVKPRDAVLAAGGASADSAASRSETRSVSTDSSAPVTARRRIRAQRITPVSPMPPTVAANDPGPFRLELEHLAAGGQQSERLDVGAEGSRAPVVLAVDVGGDRAADGDVLGSGNHCQHPSGGHERRQATLRS